MDARNRDFYVGLFVLSAMGVIVATIVRTGRIQSGDRIPIYMRTEVATGLTSDTRVQLQGLEIGRIREVVPEIDTATQELRFLARLEINVAFEDGTPIILPDSTVGEIVKANPVAAPVVQLSFPRIRSGSGNLSAGDTINSVRREEVLETLSKVAADMTDEIFKTIDQVRALLEASTAAVTEVHGQVTSVASITPRVDSILGQVSANLNATQAMITDLTPRAGVIQDSVLATVSSARTTIEGFDSLRTFVQNLAVDNQASIEEIIDQMTRTAIILGHFSDQVSRRPTRILTGVTPPPEADSVTNHR